MRFIEGYEDELKRLAKYPFLKENPIDKQLFFSKWLEWGGDEFDELKEWAKTSRARKGYREDITEILKEGDDAFRSSPYKYWKRISRYASGYSLLSYQDELTRYGLIERLFERISRMKGELDFLERHGSIIPEIDIKDNVFYDWGNEVWCDYTNNGLQT